ncbi:MAG: hypothetical protein IT287_04625 [Bdellovibrionaceae bacterium]|nr:hypothetical protein [Pseudobdellovibrionaceae bacterium]
MKQLLYGVVLFVMSSHAFAHPTYIQRGEYASGPGYWESSDAIFITDKGADLDVAVVPMGPFGMDITLIRHTKIMMQPVGESTYEVMLAVSKCEDMKSLVGKILKITRTGDYLILEAEGQVLTLQAATKEELSLLESSKYHQGNMCQ